MEKNIRTVEPTEEAEAEWVKTIVDLVGLRAAFLKECTPGYCKLTSSPNFKQQLTAQSQITTKVRHQRRQLRTRRMVVDHLHS
jgi:hypothetical protein